MSYTTAAQPNRLREPEHRTKLYLSIFRPTTVMTAQVTGTVARNDYIIPYYNPSGDYNSVLEGMTLLIGTTAGAEDVGRIRIRSVDADNFTVAENSNIDWQVGQYLTVLRFWDIWPVYPRIINDPSDATNTLWYKDYDIPYTNQNTILGAFPCAGPHRAIFTGEQVYYSATGTAHVADSAFATAWWFEGGTVTGSQVYTPGYITYDTPGHYMTQLIVSGTNGSVDKTYRYVSVYDRPETGSANAPIANWSMGNIEGSQAGGGYTTQITVRETISVHEGDVVVLFGESWYGSTKQNIGGNAENNSNIFFVGHILKGSIQYNYKFGEVTFEVGNITQYMKEQEGFSISLESVASPVDWYQLYDMDLNKAVYSYLRWQSTVLNSVDVQSLIDDRPLQYYDSDRASLYDAIDNVIRGTVLGSVVSDIQGKIWLEHGAQALPSLTSQSYSTPIMEIQKQDWIGSPRIDEQLVPAVSFIEYQGIAFSGVVTGTFAPLITNAPGSAPLYRGKQDRKSGMAPKSQVELNSIAGNILANKNYSYQSIAYQGRGTYRNLDIAPQQVVTLQVEADDTPRGIAISGSYLINSLSWAYNPQKQLFYPANMVYKPLITGTAGQTVVIPEIVDDAGFANPSPNFPYIPNLYWPAVFGPPMSTGTGSGSTGTASSLSYISINVNTVGNIVKYSGITSYSIGGSHAVTITTPSDGVYWVYAYVTGEIPSQGGYVWVTIKVTNTAVYPDTYGRYPLGYGRVDDVHSNQVATGPAGYIYVNPGTIYIDRLVQDFTNGAQTPVQLLVSVIKIA